MDPAYGAPDDSRTAQYVIAGLCSDFDFHDFSSLRYDRSTGFLLLSDIKSATLGKVPWNLLYQKGTDDGLHGF